MRPTIRQVAARANVSPMTVSHVLNGRKHAMSAETYERVLQAVNELNYVPVRTSAQNRHVETRAIGLVPFHANVSHTILDNFTQGGIYEGARKHGYDVLVMLRDETDWMANRQDVRFLDRRSDGFIFVSSGMDEWHNALKLLAENNIPTVMCYRRDVSEEIAWVDPDNEAIITASLECLWRHGHRRVAYLGSPDMVPVLAAMDPNWIVSAMGTHSNYDDIQRRAVFQAARQHHAWEQLDIITAADPHWNVFPEIVPQLLSEGITGVICSCDFIATQLLDVAAQWGVRIPHDLSVIGTDDAIGSAARGLTSVAFGYSEVGRLAVDAWVELRNGKPASQCCRIVPTQLVERASVGVPRITTPRISERKFSSSDS